MSDNPTYNQLINCFKEFADHHFFIKSFSHGEVDDKLIEKDPQLPLMHIVPGDASFPQGEKLHSFTVYFLDQARDKEDKNDNQKEILSDCFQLCQDLLAEINTGQIIFGQEVDLASDPTASPLIQVTSLNLQGWSMNITLRCNWDWSACDIPADYSLGSPSDYFQNGFRRFALPIFQDGTLFANAKGLDFASGGFELSVDAYGKVTITNTGSGGGGGGTTWRNGAGAPSNSLGVNGDYYLNDTNGDYYKKASGVYTVQGNLTGPQGATGATGATGNNGQKGDDGIGIQSIAKTSTAGLVDTYTVTLTDTTTTTFTVTNGADGADGADGVGIEFQVSGTLLQWRHIGDTSWTTAIDLSTLTVGGDVSGTLSNITVTKIHGIDVQNGTASDTQILMYDATANKWKHHTLVKADVGLGNVDNTSDASKPVSTAQATAIALKENAITAGTTSQYWRGDKSWQTLNKSAVGLGNVDNTADVDKPVSTAQSSAISSAVATEASARSAADTALSNQVNVPFKRNTAVVHTGTTSETKLVSIQFNGTLFQANDFLEWYVQWACTGSVNLKTIKCYINTSDAIGGTQVAFTTNSNSSTVIAATLQRRMSFINSVSSQRIVSPTTVVGFADNISNVAYSTTSVDFTQTTLYFIVTGTLGNSGESLTIYNVHSKILR